MNIYKYIDENMKMNLIFYYFHNNMDIFQSKSYYYFIINCHILRIKVHGCTLCCSYDINKLLVYL